MAKHFFDGVDDRRGKAESVSPSPALLDDQRQCMVGAMCAADIAWNQLIQGIAKFQL